MQAISLLLELDINFSIFGISRCDEDEWHFNEMIGMWTLHEWMQLENPDGIFAPHNLAIGD